MAFCVYCGAKLDDNSRFCGHCGARVAVEPVSAPPAAEPVSAEPVYTAPIVEETLTEPAPVVEETPAEPAHTVLVTEEAPAEPTPAASVVEETPAEPVYAAPVAEEIPPQPLYAAPITREHIRTAATPSAAQPMPFGNKSARGSSANYSYATPERVANPVQNKAVRPRRKFLAAFASVLICILLLTAMLPTFVLITARNSLKKETFLAIMERIDLHEIPASVLDEYDEDLEDMSLAEALCEAINDEVSYYGGRNMKWEELNPSDIDEFLEDTTFLEFFAECMESMVNAFLSGEETFTISAKSVEAMVDDNLDYLIETLELPIEIEDRDLVVEEIVEDLDLDGEIELPELDRSDREVMDIIGLLLSFYAIGALALLLILLVLLLFVVNHRDPLYAVRDTGIVCVLGTVLPLLLVLGGRVAVSSFAGKDAAMYLATTAISCIMESSLVVIAAIFIAGVVLLVINGIARKIQNKKYA